VFSLLRVVEKETRPEKQKHMRLGERLQGWDINVACVGEAKGRTETELRLECSGGRRKNDLREKRPSSQTVGILVGFPNVWT